MRRRRVYRGEVRSEDFFEGFGFLMGRRGFCTIVARRTYMVGFLEIERGLFVVGSLVVQYEVCGYTKIVGVFFFFHFSSYFFFYGALVFSSSFF